MARGREQQVTCEKCGRQVRRDKAVFFEKVVFSNPVDRKEVYDNQYTPRITREFAYCPSCGKHGRIYEKKKKLMQAQRERAELHPYASGPRERRSIYASSQAPQKRTEAPVLETQAPEDQSEEKGESKEERQ